MNDGHGAPGQLLDPQKDPAVPERERFEDRPCDRARLIRKQLTALADDRVGIVAELRLDELVPT